MALLGPNHSRAARASKRGARNRLNFLAADGFDPVANGLKRYEIVTQKDLPGAGFSAR